MAHKIAPCLWFDGNAEDAAEFYARTFPDSRIDAVHRSPADYPSGKEGDVLTVEFTVLGMPFLGLNGGPEFTFDEAINEDDTSMQKNGVTLLIDPMSLQYLAGAEIDYQENAEGAQFVIKNPNATSTCGCGSSFST